MVDFTESFNQYSTSKLPIFRDNFTTYSDQAEADSSWVSSDVAILRANPTTDKLDFTIPSSVLKDDAIVHDLGVGFVSDRNWTLRFKLDITAFSGNTTTSGENIGIVLSDSDETFGVPDNQNWIGMLIASAQQITDTYVIYGRVGSNVRREDTSGDFTHTVGVEVLFMEIKRISKTEIQGNIYSDEKFTDLIESITLTRPDITGLRYLKVTYRSIAVANTVLTGTVENIEFWNDGIQVIFQEDFSTSVGWVQTGSQVTISGGTLNGWGPDGTVESQTYDLQANNGRTLNDGRWITEFKFRYTAVGSSTGHFILGLADTAGDIGSITNSSASFVINKQVGPDPTANGRLTIQVGGTSFQSSGIGLDALISTDLFVRLERISINLFKLSIFSDASFTTHIPNSPVMVSGSFENIVGLDHIQSRTSTSGSNFRNITGTIDNLIISEEQTGGTEGTVTFQDDFTSYADQTEADASWIPTDITKVRVDVTNDDISGTFVADGTNDAIAIDIFGGTVSDTNWTLRYKISFQTVDDGSNTQNKGIYIGLFDEDQNSSTLNNQNAIYQMWLLSSIRAELRLARTINDQPEDNINTDKTIDNIITVRTFYTELKRTGSDTYEMSIYNDALYSDLINRQVGALSLSGVTNLRYLKIMNQFFQNGAGELVATIEDIEFYDGVSVARTPVKSIPLPDFEDSFWENNWTQFGSKIVVNTSTRVVDCDWLRDASAHDVTFDLNTVLPNGVNPNGWGLRFKLKVLTAVTGNNDPRAMVWLTENASGVATSNQDHATFILLHDDVTGDLIISGAVDDFTALTAGTAITVGTNLLGIGDTIYCEMIRNKNFWTISVYSDQDYTQLLGRGSIDDEGVSTVPDLRYLKIGQFLSSINTGGAFTGTVDKIQFWNGNNPTEHGGKWVEVNL